MSGLSSSRKTFRFSRRTLRGPSKVFQGTSLLKLDVKGRLSMPSRHRETLAENEEAGLVFTRHPDGCLLLYPESVWSRKRDELARLPFPRGLCSVSCSAAPKAWPSTRRGDCSFRRLCANWQDSIATSFFWDSANTSNSGTARVGRKPKKTPRPRALARPILFFDPPPFRRTP